MFYAWIERAFSLRPLAMWNLLICSRACLLNEFAFKIISFGEKGLTWKIYVMLLWFRTGLKFILWKVSRTEVFDLNFLYFQFTLFLIDLIETWFCWKTFFITSNASKLLHFLSQHSFSLSKIFHILALTQANKQKTRKTLRTEKSFSLW